MTPKSSYENIKVSQKPEGSSQETYRDHMGEGDRDSKFIQQGGDVCAKKISGDASFPSKLHYVLSQIEEDGLSHIISWQPHGRCFIVNDQKEFVKLILPSWFRQSKFPSFQRQLNLYGFQRLTAGRDKGGYYHEFFLRGMPNLANRIQRMKIKGTKTRKPASPDTEPNFYAMRFLPLRSTVNQPLHNPRKVHQLLPMTTQPRQVDSTQTVAGFLSRREGSTTMSAVESHQPTTTLQWYMQIQEMMAFTMCASAIPHYLAPNK